jgi:hypothetical protein
MFDEYYNIREVLDDVVDRVAMREKLIQTAKQFSEKKKDERYGLAVRQFENLMADFLKLYQPILDKVKAHREYLQKELSGFRMALNTSNAMLEVSRGVEGLDTKVQRLERDVAELDSIIKEKTKTAEKIDDLWNRIKPYQTGISGFAPRQQASDALAGMPQDLFLDMPEQTKESAPSRKSSSRN